MFCQNCGTQLTDNSKFCANCGANLSDDNVQVTNTIEAVSGEVETATAKPKKSGFAITGFVTGLVSLLIPIYAGIVCGIVGIVFSALGKRAVRIKGLRGKGLATAGLVLSIITLAVGAFDLLGLIII